MKRIKIVAIALFTLATIVNVNAQDSNNPWAVSAGDKLCGCLWRKRIFQ